MLFQSLCTHTYTHKHIHTRDAGVSAKEDLANDREDRDRKRPEIPPNYLSRSSGASTAGAGIIENNEICDRVLSVPDNERGGRRFENIDDVAVERESERASERVAKSRASRGRRLRQPLVGSSPTTWLMSKRGWLAERLEAISRTPQVPVISCAPFNSVDSFVAPRGKSRIRASSSPAASKERLLDCLRQTRLSQGHARRRSWYLVARRFLG